MARPANDRGRWRISLRARLTLWVVAIFTLILFVTGFAFWWYQRAVTMQAFHERLLTRTALIEAKLDNEWRPITPDTLDHIARIELDVLSLERIAIDVVTSEGESRVFDIPRWPRLVESLIAQSDLRTESVMRPGPEAAKILGVDPDMPTYLVAVPTEEDGVAVVVLVASTWVDQQIGLVVRVLMFAGALGVIASLVSGWLIAGIAVEPFKRLSGLATSLLPEQLDRLNDPDENGLADAGPEVQRLAAQLEDARSQLSRAFASQARFLSNVSHEIKTPIATLLLEAQTIDRGSLSEEAEEFVESAEEEMRKLGRLVESFLTLARVRDGGNPRAPKRCGANELVMDAVEDCLAAAEQHAVRLDPVLAADEAGLDAQLEGDPDLLRTMVNNLIRNAIRFSPEEESVRIVASVQGERFTVDVQDHGPGLPPELINKIFDRFVQGTDEVRRERGHGLGLAIAQGIAELHGGTIRVRNLDPRGAEFSVDLPVF